LIKFLTLLEQRQTKDLGNELAISRFVCVQHAQQIDCSTL